MLLQVVGQLAAAFDELLQVAKELLKEQREPAQVGAQLALVVFG
jgi:hypothetical protein